EGRGRRGVKGEGDVSRRGVRGGRKNEVGGMGRRRKREGGGGWKWGREGGCVVKRVKRGRGSERVMWLR
uniref:hypothetical protein n=1 Tax=Escherichia coli TaxID=562 RepID=UPI001BC85A84